MIITIPKGVSKLYYTQAPTVDLNLYKDFIYQVFQLIDESNFKIFVPGHPDFSEFDTLTTSLSYQFYALSEFEIVI